MSTAEQYVIPKSDGELTVYDPFRQQLEQLKAEEKSLVFDYAANEKAVRSHIAKLRRSKKPVDDARKAEKAAALAYERKVDQQGFAIIKAIDEMIERHDKPLREIAEREAQRVADLRKELDYIESLTATALNTPDEVRAQITRLEAVIVDETYQEFQDEALALKATCSMVLQDALTGAIKREADEAELARLRAEMAERDRLDRERQIAEEAREQARKEAEAAAERGRVMAEAAEKRQQEAHENRLRIEREARERAEREAVEAHQRVEKAAQEAVEHERRKAAVHEAAEKAAQERREADLEHKRTVNNEMVADLIQHAGTSEQTAKFVVIALAGGKVRHARVTY